MEKTGKSCLEKKLFLWTMMRIDIYSNHNTNCGLRRSVNPTGGIAVR